VTGLADLNVLPMLGSLGRIFAEIVAGVVLGQIVEALGWTRRLGALTRPLLRLGRLPDAVHVAFATAFVSGAAASSSLVGWRDRGHLTDRQVTLGAVLNGFPNQFAHLPSQLAPMALLVGPKVTAAFFGTQIAAGLARTVAVLLWARRYAGGPGAGAVEHADGASEPRPLRRRMAQAFRNSWRTLRRVGKITLPVCAVFIVLNRLGAFDGLRDWIGALPGLDGFGPQASAVVVAQLASLVTAAGVAAELLRTQIFNERTITLTLLTGSLLALPLRTLRHSLGVYVGVFGPARGARIQLVSQGLRFGFGAASVALLALLWR